MRPVKIVICLSVFLFACVSVQTDGIKDRAQLLKNLFNSCEYDPCNYPDNTTVQLGVSLISLKAKDYDNTMETTVLLRERWFDPRLQWDPKAYGGQNVLSIPSDQVWKPDVNLLNSVASPSVQPCEEAKVVISNSGQVSWVTRCQFESSCNISSNAPNYDYNGIKNCSLIFGRWVEDGTFIDLQIYDNQQKLNFELFEDLTPWEVLDLSTGKVEDSNTGGYNEGLPAQLKFEFSFRQKILAPSALPQPIFPGAAGAIGFIPNAGPADCPAGKRLTGEGTCVDGVETY